MAIPEILLYITILCYSVLAPYTKVEESFNLQSCHDILNHGIGPAALAQYDHLEFPGVVPRTFIGPLILTFFSFLPAKVCTFCLEEANIGHIQQIIVRAVLGLGTATSISFFARQIGTKYGVVCKNFFFAFQATQFHVVYYASRTLPNTFGLIMTTFSFALLLQDKIYLSLSLLTISAVIFRIELVILIMIMTVLGLLSGRLELWRVIKTGFTAGIVSLITSFTVDSYFWQYPVVPELSGFIFNAIEGRSSEWGTSPWYQYILDAVKLQLNPMAFLILTPMAIIIDTRARVCGLLVVLYLAIYSFQPHKEWRFVVYVAPLLAYMASISATWIYTRRQKNLLFKLACIGTLASIPLTGLLSLLMLLISTMNYPGGEAMRLIPADRGPVYLDVLTCMTGSTRFSQMNGNYSRSEDENVLATIDHWNSMAYASIADPEKIEQSYLAKGQVCPWTMSKTVMGYAGIDRRALKIRKEIKLYIMENEAFVRQ